MMKCFFSKFSAFAGPGNELRKFLSAIATWSISGKTFFCVVLGPNKFQVSSFLRKIVDTIAKFGFAMRVSSKSPTNNESDGGNQMHRDISPSSRVALARRQQLLGKASNNMWQRLNPFHPGCKTIFVHFLPIFRFIFQFIRPKQDGHIKFTSSST